MALEEREKKWDKIQDLSKIIISKHNYDVISIAALQLSIVYLQQDLRDYGVDVKQGVQIKTQELFTTPDGKTQQTDSDVRQEKHNAHIISGYCNKQCGGKPFMSTQPTWIEKLCEAASHQCSTC